MSAQSVIKNFMSSLDKTSLSGTAALDEAVASVSKFGSWSELIDTMAKDCAAYKGNGENFLRDMCGIILDNEDTGAITGSDAGSSTVKTAESIVPESGAWSYPNSDTFTVNGLTIKIHDFDTLNDSEKWIVGALYTWWIKESLSLINSSFGFNFNESGTTVKTLDVYFYDRADGNMAISNYSKGQKSTELRMNINMHYYNDIDTSDPNGIGSSGALVTLDRTIAHELVHAVMSANVDYYNDFPDSFKEGAAELVHGIDDKRRTQIENLSKSSSTLKSSMSGSGVSAYAAGYITLRYLAKQAAESRDPATEITPTDDTPTDDTPTDDTPIVIVEPVIEPTSSVSFDGVTLKIIGATNSDVFLSGTNPFTGEANTYGNAAAIVLDASEMTDAHFLGGNTNDNHIIAGNAGSTIWGGSNGNDIMQSGAGVDNFWFLRGCGRDLVLNFQTGIAGDVLSFVGGGVANIYREGTNFEVTLDVGSVLTVATDDATANNVINYSADSVNVLRVKIGNSNTTNDFIWEGDNVTYLGGNALDAIHVLTAGAGVNLGATAQNVEVLDASFSSGANILVGDSGNNYIISGGNNSVLWGAAGDDIMYGGTGTDIFMFGAGDGNDLIFGAEDDDVINIHNANLSDITVAQESFGLVIGVGGSALAVIGQNNSTFTFADGSAYHYNRAANSWDKA